MNGTVNSDLRLYGAATGRDLHIDTPLTNMSIAYRPNGLIADQIYPPLPVSKQSDVYYTWRKADWFTLPNAERSRGAPSKRIKFSVSSDTFYCHGFGLATDVPFEDMSNADAGLDLANGVSNYLLDQLHMAWEDRLAVTLTTTTNMASSTSLTNRWSDPVNGEPIDDIYRGFEAIRKTTGMDPNILIMSAEAWNNFRKHPDIIDWIRGKGDNRGGGIVKQQEVADAFSLDKVLIGRGVKNTAGENLPAVFTDVWSTACILLHVAAAPARQTPSHGYTFQWRPEGFPAPFAIIRREDQDKHCEVIEAIHFQAEKVTGTDLGYLIVNC